MEQHLYFDLWLHSTHELTDLLSIGITERVTLHEWPLSCVQRLQLADGSSLIYKSQLRATTVEPEFFAAVQEDSTENAQFYRQRLPRVQFLGNLHNSATMIQEFIDAPRLEDLKLDEAAMLDHGDRLLAEIRRFPVNLPVYTDISSQEKWLTFAKETVSMLNSLITTGQFRLTTNVTVQGLATWTQSDAILAALQSPPAFNHHDLGGDNVFVTPDGYKIIDWQRPVRGPAELDRAGYLTAMGIDPLLHVNSYIIGVFWFLRLRWLVECKAHWFPSGESYDQQVAEFADQIQQL